MTPFVFSGNFVIKKERKSNIQVAFTHFSLGNSHNFLQRKGKKCQDVISYIDGMRHNQRI